MKQRNHEFWFWFCTTVAVFFFLLLATVANLIHAIIVYNS